MPEYLLEGLGAYGRGKMKMIDYGYQIDLQVYVDWSSTYWGSAPLSWSSPNGSGSGSCSYPGGKVWKTVQTIYVSSSGNVSWTVGPTGTSEFGGPHTQTIYISRASAPSQVTGVNASNILHQSFLLSWTRGALNGGSFEFDQYQVSSTPQSGYGDFTGTVEITGTTSGTSYSPTNLIPGRLYYVHVRTKNNVGYGGWSDIYTVRLLPGVRVKIAGQWKIAIPYVKVSGQWKAAVPYFKKDGAWNLAQY